MKRRMYINRLDEIAGLVVKYLRKELTAEEEEKLVRWKTESREQEEEFKRLCSEAFLEEQRKQELLFSADQAKKRFHQKIKKSVPRRMLRYSIGVAALFVMLLGGTWLLLRQQQKAQNNAGPIVCGSSMARLTLGNGEIILLGEKTGRIVEANVELDIAERQLQYTDKGNAGTPDYNTLEIPRRGEYKVILADGTKVWLNSETVLRYPQIFSGKNRDVYLSGEAYFEVARDTSRPFTVHLNGQGRIRVLGTSFNVHAYREEGEVYTTLTEGRVNIQVGNRTVDLTQGEQAVWERSGNKLSKQQVDVRLFTAWKDGRFVFRKERLEDILNTVARWYDVKIIYENENVKDFSFSGNVERYDDFDKIIAMLEMTRMVNFKVEKNTLFVYEVK